MMNYTVPQVGGFTSMPLMNGGANQSALISYNSGYFNNLMGNSLLGSGTLVAGADQVNLSGESSGLLGATGTSTTGTTANAGTATTGTAVGDSTANFICQMIAKLSTSTNSIAAQLLSSTGTTGTTGTSTTGTAATTGTGTTGTGDSSSLDAIGKQMATFKHSLGTTTSGDALEKGGVGDCWAGADWLNKKLKASGFESRIIQYATDQASNHRSVQYKVNGQWVDFDYKKYGINKNFANWESGNNFKVISS